MIPKRYDYEQGLKTAFCFIDGSLRETRAFNFGNVIVKRQLFDKFVQFDIFLEIETEIFVKRIKNISFYQNQTVLIRAKVKKQRFYILNAFLTFDDQL